MHLATVHSPAQLGSRIVVCEGRWDLARGISKREWRVVSDLYSGRVTCDV
jgi:hypothetical protein